MKVRNEKSIDLIYSRYLNDFPKCERKTKKKLAEMLKDGKYKLRIFEEALGGKESCDVAYILSYEDGKSPFVWVDFFAVFSEFRNTGIGSCIICKLKERFRYIVLEVEPSDGVEGSVTSRREAFYKRLGAVKINVPYAIPTPDGKMPLNLFVIGVDGEFSVPSLGKFVKDAVGFIHSDLSVTESVIASYINAFK